MKSSKNVLLYKEKASIANWEKNKRLLIMRRKESDKIENQPSQKVILALVAIKLCWPWILDLNKQEFLLILKTLGRTF